MGDEGQDDGAADERLIEKPEKKVLEYWTRPRKAVDGVYSDPVADGEDWPRCLPTQNQPSRVRSLQL